MQSQPHEALSRGDDVGSRARRSRTSLSPR